jgi:hypothetical protein
LTYPLKNDGVKVRLEKILPTIGENKIHVPNHQPDFMFGAFYGSAAGAVRARQENSCVSGDTLSIPRDPKKE